MAKKVVRYHLVRHKWPDEIEAEKKIKKRRILTVAACIVFFIGGFLSNNVWSKSTSATSDEDFKKFFDIYQTMSTNFYFGKDKDDLKDTLISGAINGMVDAGGDPHTMYLEPTQSKSFTSSMEGSFVGIGVSYFEQSKGVFIISKVYKDSPAQEAGLMSGDQIYAIKGKPVKDLTIDEVADMIKGDTGSKIEIEIVRENKHIKKTVERRKVNDSVLSSVNGEVGILEIDSYAETTGEEVKAHLEDLKKAGCKRLVIDMRDNSGGYLTAVQDVASYLMGPDKLIFKEDDKNGKVTDYKTKDVEHYTFDKLVVLVNDGTASAAEVLTAALKQQMNATVVGVKTYGKGTVQIPVTFSDGSMFKYTVGEWITPNGDKINEVGIEPDVEVKLDPALTLGAPKLDEDEVYKPDSVSLAAKSVQTYLKFLGYPVDRTDEYFSIASGEALKQYQKKMGMEANGNIDSKVITSLLSSISQEWNAHLDQYDTQMKKAVEIANG